MTREQLLKKIEWDEYDLGRCALFVDLFQADVVFVFFQDHPQQPTITQRMVDCVNDVLNLPHKNLIVVKELLWEECNFTFQVADYGCEPIGTETALEAHLRDFEIADSNDAFEKSRLREIHIHQSYDALRSRYSKIQIDSATDNIISVIVKDGVIIDYDDDGTELQPFEDDPQFAKNRRLRVLSGP